MFETHTKEIKTGKEKTFIGKERVCLNISQLCFIMPNEPENPFSKNTLTMEEFQEYNEAVEQIISDPTYQSIIIDGLIDGIESFWKYKKLGGTWIETRAESLKNVPAHVEEAFLNLIITIESVYSIEALPEYFIDTPRRPIGLITGAQVKTCNAYPALIETAIQFINDRIENDMKENIENDNTRIFNDMMMLKTLLKKYPDFSMETIHEI